MTSRNQFIQDQIGSLSDFLADQPFDPDSVEAILIDSAQQALEDLYNLEVKWRD